jgi:hypothetical protein
VGTLIHHQQGKEDLDFRICFHLLLNNSLDSFSRKCSMVKVFLLNLIKNLVKKLNLIFSEMKAKNKSMVFNRPSEEQVVDGGE